MSDPAPKRTFVKDDHRVSTGVPAEAVRLQARGYREENADAPVAADTIATAAPAQPTAEGDVAGQSSTTTVSGPKSARNKSE